MLELFLGCYFLAIIFLAKKNIRLAIAWLIISLPTYLLRFKVGPLPTTLLELTFGGLAVAWLLFYVKSTWPALVSFFREHRFFMGATVIFLLASVASIFVSDMVVASLGQWRAYFLEPIILFFILISLRERISGSDVLWFLAVSTLSISLYSIVQHVTGWGIATAEWTNPATRRVTAFFSSPNAVALYLGPITMLMVGWLYQRLSQPLKKGEWRQVIKQDRQVLAGGCIVLTNLIAILFTKSQGGLLALGLGVMVFAYLVGHKKIIITAVLIAFIGGATLVFFPRVLPLHYKSGGNRLTLWTYSINYLTESPQHFVFGTGIRQFFRKIQKPFYNPKQLERLIYPHNIFLNFWTEVGLVGLLSMVCIMGYVTRSAFRLLRTDRWWGVSLLAMLVVIVAHGFVDVPYFKNDLAMEWWLFLALFFTICQDQTSPRELKKP